MQKIKKNFQTGQKPSGLSFRIPIVILKSDLPVQKFLRFFQINSQSRKNLASLKFTLNQKPKRSKTMNLQKAKIYHDGSYFVAIPKGVFPSGKGCKRRVIKTTEPNNHRRTNLRPKPQKNALKQLTKKVCHSPRKSEKSILKRLWKVISRTKWN